jgi:hypothetical protein
VSKHAYRSVLVVAAALLSFPAGVPSQATQVHTARAPVTVSLADAIDKLVMAEESGEEGYTRTSFPHWTDGDADGCSTRAEVLIEEAVEPPSLGSRCALRGGSWFSYYDARTVRSASSLDVAHTVPLLEAWKSGGSAWSAARRKAYANDLGAAYTLVAVSAGSMQAKGNQDPALWLPPAADMHCRYAADWVATKLRWSLSLNEAEHQALFDVAQKCRQTKVTYELAEGAAEPAAPHGPVDGG